MRVITEQNKDMRNMLEAIKKECKDLMLRVKDQSRIIRDMCTETDVYTETDVQDSDQEIHISVITVKQQMDILLSTVQGRRSILGLLIMSTARALKVKF